MPIRKDICDLYLKDFSACVTAKKITQPDYLIVDEDISESIESTRNRFRKYIRDICLSEDERRYVINAIKATYSIYQEDGCAILGDYNHDYDWYKNLLSGGNHSEYFWCRYKKYLADQRHFSPNVIDVLENNTLLNIMSYLGNPADESPFSVRGLVVGDVQSGKTSNYIGLISKAADAGYRVIFLLTGTIESLRRQTQQRVEEGFIGWDSFNARPVGVGRGEIVPQAFTSRAKDFVATDNQNTNCKLSNYSSVPMIFVIKKNVSVLRKVYSALRNINTTAQHPTINFPALVIDDEADNASINTNKEDDDPTKINKLIRNLLSLFSRNSYVGFTATPFANVFIRYDKEEDMVNDDLFPRDFIYALNAPSNYCGPRKYFAQAANGISDSIEFIEDYDESLFPMKHGKDWCGERLFKSLYESINSFLLANAIRDIREGPIKNTHRSMLINMSRFINVQLVIRDIVRDYFDCVKRCVKQTCKLPESEALSNPLIGYMKKTYDKIYRKIAESSGITWPDVFRRLYDSISKIKIVVVNSARNSAKLNYDEESKDGLRVIAIGGLALSRGLTLEGLMTSYFYRNTSTFDVLMQMGRWFGYRDGYSDLCKIYITKEAYDRYEYIYQSIEALKSDIKTMGQERRKPNEFGIRVMNDSFDLGITAPNKMRNTMQKIVRRSFFGSVFETPYISRNLDDVEENIANTLVFFEKINLSQKDVDVKWPYFRNVPFKQVKDLIDVLKIPCENGTYFDKAQISKFMGNNMHLLPFFDVLVMGGKAKINGIENTFRFKLDSLKIDIPLVTRGFDVRDGNIRVSKNRLRLGGKTDTAFGLKESEMPLTRTKSQDYMIEGRNPLLIIYFIRPTNRDDDEDIQDFFVSQSESTDPKEEQLLRDELGARKHNFIVGYGLGFQKVQGTSDESTKYTVNRTVNYFDLQHDDGLEE